MPQYIRPAALKVPYQSVGGLVDAVKWEYECDNCGDQDEHCEQSGAACAPLEFGGEAEEPARRAVHGVPLGGVKLLKTISQPDVKVTLV